MDDEFQHFLEAQDPVLDRVVRELTHGKKQSHWMWFIFPQLLGLGHSHMARRFAIHSLAQATHYLHHPVLGPRLRQHTGLVLAVENRTISDILGDPDELKFRSCMTLFALAATEEPLFLAALTKYFAGLKDQNTIQILSGSEPA
jgi:uncharacterized protein (DUF1810 family)